MNNFAPTLNASSSTLPASWMGGIFSYVTPCKFIVQNFRMHTFCPAYVSWRGPMCRLSGPLNYFHQIPDFGHLLIDLPNTIAILGVPKGDSDICGHDCRFSGSMYWGGNESWDLRVAWTGQNGRILIGKNRVFTSPPITATQNLIATCLRVSKSYDSKRANGFYCWNQVIMMISHRPVNFNPIAFLCHEISSIFHHYIFC